MKVNGGKSFIFPSRNGIPPEEDFMASIIAAEPEAILVRVFT